METTDDNQVSDSEIVIYEAQDGVTKLSVSFDGDTVWLQLDQMAQLFGRDKSTISRHIKNIFDEEELQRESVVAKNATTASDSNSWITC